MEHLLGLLRVHIHRGVNLAVRDVTTSDPYVIIRMGKQKLKTRVVKNNINPEWNEDLTLSILEPLPVKLIESAQHVRGGKPRHRMICKPMKTATSHEDPTGQTRSRGSTIKSRMFN